LLKVDGNSSGSCGCVGGISSGFTLLVPDGARYIKIQPLCTDWQKNEAASAKAAESRFMPGTPEIFQRNLLKVASAGMLCPLDILHKESRFIISTPKVRCQGLRKTAALKQLMYNMGVSQADAHAMLSEATAVSGKRRSFLLKVAQSYEDSMSLEGLRMPEVEPKRETEEGVKPYVMADQAVDVALRASQAGIREVFDTKVLQKLLEVADPAEVRRDYISKLIRAMDATGRLLFQYYWNLDEFIDQYGDDQASELENKLRQLFRETGDLALFLREKTGEFDIMGDVEQDISQDIATATESTSE
jgi:hypothetical protein